MNHQSHRLRGIILIISGAMLWGATGPLMEWVLSNSELTVPFMLTVRLVLAGIILLSFLFLTKKM